MTAQFHTRRAVGLALAATACLALTACGGASSVGTSTSVQSAGSTSSTSTGSAASGAPIVLEIPVAVTGPNSAPAELAGAQDAAAAINAAGGVKGRPIKIINCDDQYDANKAADCARKAKGLGVVAYVGGSTSTGDTYMPLLAAAKIPVVGAVANSKSEFGSALFYSIGSGSLIELAGAGALMAKANCKTIGSAYLDFAAAKFAAQTYLGKGLSTFGRYADLSVAIPTSATDYTTYAASLVSKGADCVNIVAGADSTTKMISALREASPTVRIFEPAASFGPKTIKTLGSAADGVYLVGGITAPANLKIS